jgi:BirA family biotin operon repressor/biotin-[acetyl-CoA-carboxylase] ligase
VGIGINVSTSVFPEDLRDIAASLGAPGVTRNQLAAEITGQLLQLSENISDKSYLDEYRARSLVLGKRIRYYSAQTARDATAIGIDDNGGLVVQHEDGSRQVLFSGEISVRLA